MADTGSNSFPAGYAAALQKLRIPEAKSKFNFLWVKRFEQVALIWNSVLNFPLSKGVAAYSPPGVVTISILSFHFLRPGAGAGKKVTGKPGAGCFLAENIFIPPVWYYCTI
jgi:hypothetical protein